MGKKRMRKRYESSFKARVALAALKDDKTLSELASEYGVHRNVISQWKRRLLSNVSRVFEELEDVAQQDHQAVVEELHRQIGQLHVELDWLKKRCPVRPLNGGRGSPLATGDRASRSSAACWSCHVRRTTTRELANRTRAWS